MSSDHNGARISPEAFQGIVRERRAEVKGKAEEERLENLKRIQEMKSTEGVHPVEIFPKEIWELILDKLDAEDRGNMWKLHEMFRDLMQSSNIRDNLLPRVLKIDFNQSRIGHDDSSDDDDEDEDGGGDAEVQVKVPLAHHLSLRGVSKTLRNAVDLALEEDLLKSLREGDFENKPKKTTSFHFHCDDDSDPEIEKLNRFLAFSESNDNSFQRFFPSRSLRIKISMLELDENFMEHFDRLKNKIVNLLRKAGKDIWHFCFRFSQFEETGENRLFPIYLALIEWLALMPHLKWLQLYLYSHNGLENNFDIRLLESDHDQYQPPKLKSLERIDLIMSSEMSNTSEDEIEAIHKALVAANEHITRLHLFGCQPELLLEIGSLPLESFYSGFLDNDVIKTDTLNWNLKRLSLTIPIHLTILSAIQFLQRFPSLEQVSLDMENLIIGKGIGFLKLPNLTEFDLSFSVERIKYQAPIHFFLSLQFLLLSKKLKKLKWSNGIKDVGILQNVLGKREEAGNLIGFGGGWGDLGNSNMWQVFPRLEYVRTSVKLSGDKGSWSEKTREYRDRVLVSERVSPSPL